MEGLPAGPSWKMLRSPLRLIARVPLEETFPVTLQIIMS